MKKTFTLCALLLSCLAQASESEIQFTGGSEAIMLSGTVRVTEHQPQYAAVLLSVTGPTDRDLTLGVHQYFKTLADGLAEHGMASLRYDDRGVGQSTGVYLDGSFQDRVADACAAKTALAQQLKMDEKHIGFIGMSEGGGLAQSAAHQCGPAAFSVMLSTPLRQGIVELKWQMGQLLEKGPFTDEQKAALEKASLSFLELVSADQPEINKEKILEMLQGPYGQAILPAYYFVPKTPEAKTDFVLSAWYQSQIHYDVSTALKAVKTPVLAVYGGKDWVVDTTANQAHLQQVRPDISVVQLDDLNHLMQAAQSGSPMEYAYLPDNFSKVIIQKISEWIDALPVQ